MMKRIYFTYFALSLVLAMSFTLSGCSSSTPAKDDAQDSEPREETQKVEPSPEPSEQEAPAEQEPPAEVEEPVSAEDLYASVLEKYTTALTQGYDMGQLRDAGLNYLCAYHDASEIGYAFLDTDQNGIPELLIGAIGGEDFFFDLYTSIEEIPILVAQSSERNRYYLCADGAIANEGSSSASNSTYAYYNIGEQGQLILSEAVIYDEDYSSDCPWYSTSSISAEGASPLSWESAELIFKKHEYVIADYTPFVTDSIHNSEPDVAGQPEQSSDTKLIDEAYPYLREFVDLAYSDPSDIESEDEEEYNAFIRVAKADYDRWAAGTDYHYIVIDSTGHLAIDYDIAEAEGIVGLW